MSILNENRKEEDYCKISEGIGKSVILDQKSRMFSPNMDSGLWSAAALVLHIRHRNAEDLLNWFLTFVELYKHYLHKCENRLQRNNEYGLHITYSNLRKH